MSHLREAAQQALEALEQSETTVPYEGFGMARRVAEWRHQAAITALRAALAEPVQEAAFHVFNVTVTGNLHEWEPTTFAFALRDGKHALFTAPQSPQRKPMTEEEIESINRDLPLLHMQASKGSVAVVFARAIERAHGIGSKA